MLQAMWTGPILLLLYTYVNEGRFAGPLWFCDHQRALDIVFEMPLQ